MPDDRMNDPAYQRARKRVEELQGFYSHLAVYLLVNLGLFAINMVTNREHLWFFWPFIGWGIALLIHATFTFFQGPFSERWVDRKTQQLMEKDRSRWQPPRPHAP
jgi:hypothetical protein